MGDVLGPAVLALIAAICFAASQVTVRRGLVENSIVSAVFTNLTTALVVIGISVTLDPPDSIDREGLLLFALAGLAAPGVARWAGTVAVHRLGPSVAVPITQGTRPLLAVVGALFFLREELSVQSGIGVLAIIAGGWELSRSRDEARTMPMGSLEGDVERNDNGQQLFRPGIIFPLLAGGAYAISDLLVKTALNHLSHPRFGALVAMVTGLTVWGTVVTFTPATRRQLEVRRGFGWLILSGSLAGLALISLFSALEAGDVTLVSPVTASSPLAVFVFSRLLLRNLEEIQASTIIAACAIVSGTVLVSISSP